MTLRLALAGLLALAAPAALAQADSLAAVWPLAPGNTWTYVVSIGETSPGGGTSALAGAATWTVLDSVDVAAGRLPRLRVEYGGEAALCLVEATASGAASQFRLLAETGTDPCAVPYRSFPQTLGGDPAFAVYAVPDPVEVVVGGEMLGSRPGRFGVEFYDESPPIVASTSRQTVDALGVLHFGYQSGTTNSVSSWEGTLRQATVGGVPVGQPLGTRADFWPLAVGNQWQFRLADRDGTDLGAIVWTVEADGAGVALRMEHVQEGAVAATATCPLVLTEATPATSWRTTFRLTPCTVPRPFLTPTLDGAVIPFGLDTYTPGVAVAVGPQTVVADVAQGGRYDSGGHNGPERSAEYALARGLGPVRFSIRTAPPAQGQLAPYWTATLGFARVGDETYGAVVVAGSAGPDAAAPALTAGPNPSRGAVALTFALPAPAADVAVEVVDALGRTVQRVALGARPAGTGTAALDLSALAPGAYTVRLAAGEAVLTTRVSVVR